MARKEKKADPISAVKREEKRTMTKGMKLRKRRADQPLTAWRSASSLTAVR